MKMYLKRALSLILAVVMAMSLLPLNVLAATVMDTEEGAGRAETPIQDRSDAVARTSGRTLVGGDERPEVPGGGDESGDLNWRDVDLQLTIDKDGNYTVDITAPENARNGQAGQWVLLVAPNVSPKASNGTPSKLKELDILKDSLQTKSDMQGAITNADVGWIEGSYDIQEGADFKFNELSYQITGKVMGFDALKGALKTAGGYYTASSKVEAAEVDGETGIEFVAYLVTKGNAPAMAEATATMKGEGGKAVLEAVPGTIELEDTSTSLEFTLQHTSESSADAIIDSVTWQGTGTMSFPMSNPSGITQAKGSDNFSASMSAVTDGSAPHMGDIVIQYHGGDSGSQTLRIHVTTKMDKLTILPIEITVKAGGPSGEGSFTVPESDDWTAVVICKEDVILLLDDAFDGKFQVVDNEDNITIQASINNDYESDEQIWGTWTDDVGYQYTGGAVAPGVTSTEGGQPSTDLTISARATSDVVPGRYVAGYIDIPYVDADSDSGAYGLFTVPVIVTVEAADAPEPEKGTVTVNVKGNDAVSGSELPITGTVTLRKNGDIKATIGLTTSATGDATVEYGTYELWLDGKDTGCTVTVESAAATGTIVLYSLDVSSAGNGTVEFTPKGYGDGQKYYIQGAEVNITASPLPDYNFEAWVADDYPPTYQPGSGATNAEATIVMNGQTEVQATFAQKPPETWTAKVTTKHGDTATDPGGKVELRKSGDPSGIELTAPGGGTYTKEGLTPGEEYEVWVNGFKTGDVTGDVTVSSTQAEVEVTLIQLSSVAQNEPSVNHAYIGIGDVATDKTSVFVPYGAKSGEGLGPNIRLKAVAGPGWRMSQKNTVDPKDSNGWTVQKVSGDDSEVGMSNDEKNKVEPTVTLDGVKADRTFHAHFVQQFKVTVKVDGGTPDVSHATFTEAQSGGTVIDPDKTSATVDKETWVKVVFEAGAEEQLDHWSVTGNGKLYKEIQDGDDNSVNTATEVSDPENCKDKTLYFVPGTDNAEVVAHVKAATYEARVQVKKDNTEWRDSGKRLALYQGGESKYDMEDSDSDGTFTTQAVQGEYEVYADDVATGKKVTLGSSSGGDNSAEVNYYTVKLVRRFSDGGTSNDVKVGFTADDKETDEKVVLATSDEQTINIYATLNNQASSSPYYRFATWEASPELADGRVDAATTPNTHYTLPGETTLTGADIRPDNQITLTAHYTKQYKVTVVNDGPSHGSVDVPPGATVQGSGFYTFVDEDGTLADVTAKANDGWRVQKWTVEPDGGATLTPLATNPTISIQPKQDVTVTVYWEEAVYTGTVNLVYSDGTPYAEGPRKVHIVLKPEGDVVKTVHINNVDAEIDGSGYTRPVDPDIKQQDSTGTWTCEKLAGGTEYRIYVNGYDTGKTISAGGGETQEVTMYGVATDVTVDDVDDENTGNHTLTIKGTKMPNHIARKDTIYFPETIESVVITLDGKAGTGFQLDSAPYAAYKYGTHDNNEQGAEISGAVARTTLTLNDLGTGKANDGQDVLVVAKFVSVHQVTVTAGVGGKVTAPSKSPTEVQHGTSVQVAADKAEGYASNTTKDAAFVEWGIESGNGEFGSKGSGLTISSTANTDFYPSENSVVHARFKALTGEGTLNWELNSGYTPDAIEVTLKNPGEENTGMLTATLGGDNASAFDLQDWTDGTQTVQAGGSATVTIKVIPKVGQTANTYHAYLEVKDGEGLTIQLPITMVVNDPTTFNATIETYPDGSKTSANIQDVTLVPRIGDTGNVKANKTTPDGTWTATGLAWGTTYDVYVNGYKTNMTVDKSHAEAGTYTAFEVKDLYTVSFEKAEYKDGDAVQGTPSFVTIPEGKTGAAAVTVVPTNDSGGTHAIVVPGGGTITLTDGAKQDLNGRAHYRFDKWMHTVGEAGSTEPGAKLVEQTYTVGEDGIEATRSNAPIKLDPQYKRQYKVTLGTAQVNPGVSLPAPSGVTVKMNGGDSKSANQYVLVDEGTPVVLGELSADPSGYIFAKWTADGEPTFSELGNETETDKTAKFTPKADTTIYPNYYVKPKLTPGSLTYDITTGNWTVDGSSYTWTQNDAVYGKVTLESADGVQVQESGSDNRTFSFKEEELKKLPKGNYTLKVESTTGRTPTELTATLEIRADDPQDLIEVKIQVENGNGDTANVTDVNRNRVEYLSHLDAGIVKENKLTWQWYYGNTAPHEGTVDDGYDPTSSDDGIKIEGATSDSLDISGHNEYKGKYLYAMVTADVTGTGTVVTNSIAVDYDATVTVKKDGETDGVDDTGYTVYLVPQDVGSPDFGTELASQGIVTATYSGADGKFTATLKGGTTYTVYVNAVEGKTTAGSDPIVATTETVSPSDIEATVEYFSVNAVKTVQKKILDSNSKVVDDDLSDMAQTVFTLGSTTVDDGNGVLTGQTVTAKASKTWVDDYHADWGNGDTATLDYNKTSAGRQTPTTAHETGTTVQVEKETYVGFQLHRNLHAVMGNIFAYDDASSSARIETTNENVPTLTDGAGHVFKAKPPVGNNGGDGGVIKFYTTMGDDGVPTGTYTLKVTTVDGTVWEKTVDYSTSYDDTSIVSAHEIDADSIVVGTDAGDPTEHQLFTVVLNAASYGLKVGDGTVNAEATSSMRSATAEAEWTKYYTQHDAETIKVTVSNTGNTTLTLTPSLKVGGEGVSLGSENETYTIVGGFTVSGLTVNGATFQLKPKETKELTIAIPQNLNVKDAKDVELTFTSSDTGANKRTVTYKLDVELKPLTVTAVKAPVPEADGKTYKVADAEPFTLTTDTPLGSIPTAVTEKMTTGEDTTDYVVYEWYAVNYGATVTLDPDTGELKANEVKQTPVSDGTVVSDNGKTFTVDKAKHAGKSVYLVARGTGLNGNVVGAATNSAAPDEEVLPPHFTVPYEGKVQLFETGVSSDKAAVGTNNASYEVYFVEQGDAFAFGTATKGEYDPGTQTYQADLDPAKSYDVYTNTLFGKTDTEADFARRATIPTGVQTEATQVDYYEVAVENTKVNNSRYESQLDDYTSLVYTHNSTHGKPAATGSVQVSDTQKFVASGTRVEMTYSETMDKDYTLSWSGLTVTPGNEKTASGEITGPVTVGTTLTLKLYEVSIYVVSENTGSLDEVTLAVDGGPTFSNKSGSHIVGLDPAKDTLPVPGPYRYSVPKADYKISATATSGTTIEGYSIPHTGSTTPSESITAITDVEMNVSGANSMDIVVASTDTALSLKDGETPDQPVAQATSNGTTGEDATFTRELTLPYGYDEKKITLTLQNRSSRDQVLYDVTAAATDSDTTKITYTSDGFVGSSGADETYDKMTEDESKTVTLTIPEGLTVKESGYTYTLAFSYNPADGVEDGQATVTYELKITVEPAEFDEVTVVADPTGGDILNPATQGLKLEKWVTKENDLWGKSSGSDDNYLDETTDYTYQWYHGPVTAGPAPTVNWTADGNVTVTGDLTEIGSATNSTLGADQVKNYEGRNLYLVVKATSGSEKVINAAISTGVTVGYTGKVKFTKDGVKVEDTEGPGYTVEFRSGAETVKANWNETTHTYESESPLDPNKTYDVYVGPYQGATNATETVGTMTGPTSPVTAEVFTVTAKETTTQDYEDYGENFASKPTPGITCGGVDVNHKTVLKGQTVTAKFEDVGDGKGWTQDYTLTWQNQVGNSADGSTLTDAGKGTATAEAAVSTGADWTINEKTYIGGELNQNTYTITGTVSGSTGTVEEIKVTGTTTGGSKPYDKTEKGAADGGIHNGESVTFTVVAGTYTITPSEAAGTVISTTTWEGDDQHSKTITEKTVPDATGKKTYNFTVELVGAKVQLTVSDDDETVVHSVTAEHTGKLSNAHEENEVTRYFYHIGNTAADATATGQKEYKLTVENTGNVDFNTVEVKAFLVEDPSVLADNNYFQIPDNWSTPTDSTSIQALDYDASALTGGPLAAGGLVANAVTITLSETAKHKDGGAIVFRFEGTSDDGTCVAYYVLDLTVEQLPIVEVKGQAKDSQGTVLSKDAILGVGDKVEVKGYSDTDDKSLENVTVQTSTKPDNGDAKTNGLTDEDVKFAWFWSDQPLEEAALRNAVELRGGKLEVKAAPGARLVRRSEEKSYTLTKEDLAGYLYLAAYAPNDDVNASDMAWYGAAESGEVSPPFETQKVCTIQVTLDNNILPTRGTAEPGYALYISTDQNRLDKTGADAGTSKTAWAVKDWNGTNKWYSVGVDENKTYYVFAPSYKGSTTYVNTGLTVGKQTDGSTKLAATVPYWTVRWTPNVAVHNEVDGLAAYLPGSVSSGAEGNRIQDALSVKVSGDKAEMSFETNLPASGTPVLDGMQVQVNVAADKKNNNGTPHGWDDFKEYHTLTATGWTVGKESNGIGYPADDNVVEGDAVTVTAAQNFSATLAQKLFEVTFKVKDVTTPMADASITGATLTLQGGPVSGFDHVDGELGGDGTNDDTVTFKNVPAANYTIAATAATDTVVKGYTWNSDDVSTTGENVEVTADETKNKNEKNTIQIETMRYQIQWSDNFDATTGGTISGFNASDGFQKVDGAEKLALSYGYTAADTLSYTVRVKNTGNSDLVDFQIAEADTAENFTADLTSVKVYGTTGSDTGTTANVTTTGFTLKVGESVEFTVTIPVGKAAKTENYTAAFTASAGVAITAGTGVGEKLTYTPAYQVKKAVITRAKATGIDAPTKGGEPDGTVTSDLWPSDSLKDNSPDSNPKVEWSYTDPADGQTKKMQPGETFAPGRKYTVTVTYTPDENHQFDDAYTTDVKEPTEPGGSNPSENTGYTIQGKQNGVDGAEVKVDEDGNLTMSYTFAPTAPELVVVATSIYPSPSAVKQGQIDRFNVKADGKVDVYYVVVKVDPAAATAPTAEQIITAATTEGVDTLASVAKDKVPNTTGLEAPIVLDKLDNGTTYMVYAAAVMAETKTDSPDAIAAAAANAGTGQDGFTTAYRVEAKLPDDMATGNNSYITEPTSSTVTGDNGATVGYVQAADTDKSIGADDKVVENAVKTGTLEVVIQVNDNFSFSGWTIEEGSGEFDGRPVKGSTSSGGRTPYTSNFTPKANSTLTAAFDSLPGLQLSGTPRSNQIDKGYDSSVTILSSGDGARATNIGTGPLLGEGKLIVTPQLKADGSPFTVEDLAAGLSNPDSIRSNFFLVTENGQTYNSGGVSTGYNWKLAAGDYGVLSVYPYSVDGADPFTGSGDNKLSAAWASAHYREDPNVDYKAETDAEPEGIYYGILWVYDDGASSFTKADRYVSYDQMDLEIHVVDDGWVGRPLDMTWDLNPRANGNTSTGGTLDADLAGLVRQNTNWVMDDINLKGYDADQELTMIGGTIGGNPVTANPARTMQKPTEWQLSITGYTADFTFYKAALAKLAQDGVYTAYDNADPAAGATQYALHRGDQVRFAMTMSNSINSSRKTMRLNYVDTRPDVHLTDISGVARVGGTLTAQVGVTSNDGGPKGTPTYDTHDLKSNYGVGADGTYDVAVRWYRVNAGVTVPGETEAVAWLAAQAEASDGNVELVQETDKDHTGADALSYTVTKEDLGKQIYCTIQGDDVYYVGSGAKSQYVGLSVNIQAWRSGTETAVAGTGVTASFGSATASAPGSLFINDAGDITLNASQMAGGSYFFNHWDAILAQTKDGEPKKESRGSWDPPSKTTTEDVKHTLDTTLDSDYDLESYTIVAYYDLLPTLGIENSPFKLYNDPTSTAPVLNYVSNDGGDNDGDAVSDLTIVIKPQGGASFRDPTKNDAGITLTVGGDGQLTFAKSGAAEELDGSYTLSADWITANLLTGSYDITFYDNIKGSKATGGNAAYDKTVTLVVTADGVPFKVQTADHDENAEDDVHTYWGKVSTDGTTYTAPEAEGLAPVGGTGNIYAQAEPGYKFKEWKLADGDTKSKIGDATSASTTFAPGDPDAVVEAVFEVAGFDVKEPDPDTPEDPSKDKDLPDPEDTNGFSATATAQASVFYGDDALTSASGGALVIRGDADESVAAQQKFNVAMASEDDLTQAGITDPERVANFLAATTGDGAWIQLAGEGANGAYEALGANSTVQVKMVDGKSAKGVHVKKAAGADVTNELVVYLKVTETGSGKTEIVPYTVDVKTSGLDIIGAVDGNGFLANFQTDHAGAYPKHGDAVDKEYFTFTNVVNHENNVDVVDASTNAGGTDNNGVVDNGEWTVKPTTYNGIGANVGSDKQNSNEYEFTFTYKPKVDAEKYDYASTTAKITFPVSAPDLSLMFSDTLGKAAGETGELAIGRGQEYSEIGTDNAPNAPTAMELSAETYRKGENIVYLDTLPTYTVTLVGAGDIYGVKVTEELVGFKVVGDKLSFTDGKFLNSEADKTFALELAPRTGTTWAGEHTAKYTVTGYATETAAAAGGTPDVTATYEITFKINQKTITRADVTLTEPAPGNRPEDGEVTVETDLDPELKPDGTDKYDNTPVTPEVKWTDEKGDPVDPTKPFEPGKEYKATVTLTPDPNYQFAEEVKPNDPTTPTNDPNYTWEDKGDKDWPDPKGNDTLTVTPGSQGELTFEKEMAATALMFEDAKEVETGAAPDAIGPAQKVERSLSVTTGSKLGKYTVSLGAYGGDVTAVTVGDDQGNTMPATGWTLTPDRPATADSLTDVTGTPAGDKLTFTLDLSDFDTSRTGSYTLTLNATGTDRYGRLVEATYTLTIEVTRASGGGGGGGGGGTDETVCPNQVSFLLGLYGTTNDPVMEMVADKGKVKSVPTVHAVEGYKFLGWSLKSPTGDADVDAKRELVDPKGVTITGDTVFYAVYEPVYTLPERPFHEHYVIGYPNGEFGPTDDINRASVATIIARAVLPNFVEGADYGNPGGYSDVEGHWAASAIAYCSKYGVFQGYEDGTFRPNQSITRQELALVVARLSGVKATKELPFTDMGDAGDWAVDGIYTAYVNGWVNGYPDGTFRPLNPIHRDETVKIFNAYLHRGVDEAGLAKLTEYVHSGVASNVTENGTTEYMTWPDVPKDHWAYYEIIEAANDHEYAVDETQSMGYTVPETWDKCWIDEKWRYHDDLTDGGPTVGLLSAGFRTWNR